MPVRRIFEVASWTTLALAWLRFWLEDLRHADAQLLLLLPAATTVVGACCRQLRAGLLGGIGLAWAFFLHRASTVGCTGVSRPYDTMLAVTAAILALSPIWLIRGDDPRRG